MLLDRPAGFYKSAGGIAGLLRGSFVFVEEAAEDGSAPDPLLGEIGGGMVRPGRVQLAPAVGIVRCSAWRTQPGRTSQPPGLRAELFLTAGGLGYAGQLRLGMTGQVTLPPVIKTGRRLTALTQADADDLPGQVRVARRERTS